jgi:hypothetical protein
MDPDRVVRQHRRIRTVGTHRRSDSFLQYLVSVQNLTRAIAGAQQAGLHGQGNEPALASHPLQMSPISTGPLHQHRPRRPSSTTLLQPNIAGLGRDMANLSIHGRSSQPSHPPTIRVTSPTSAPMPSPSWLSMHSLGDVDIRIAERDTQLPFHLNGYNQQNSDVCGIGHERHPISCECEICRAGYSRSPQLLMW